jgi:dihydropteroate synthase
MGILNITPDSFSDGASFDSDAKALAQAERLLSEGADIIDVGGESTRPGHQEVSAACELARILPTVRELAGRRAVVSVDTRHAAVAAACLAAGAQIINDVSGFRDVAMAELAATSCCGLVVMHWDAASNQRVPAWLLQRARELEAIGVARERICLDPGPGFDKGHADNLTILGQTTEIAGFGYPLMAAWSRKRFVAELCGESDPTTRDCASAQVASAAVTGGADVLRVHNVKLHVEMLHTREGLRASQTKDLFTTHTFE